MNVPVYLDPQFLRNLTTNFDEILHVAQACTEEGFGTTGTSGYSPVQFLEPKFCRQPKCPDVRTCPDLCPMSVRMSHVRPYVLMSVRMSHVRPYVAMSE